MRKPIEDMILSLERDILEKPHWSWDVQDYVDYIPGQITGMLEGVVLSEDEYDIACRVYLAVLKAT